MTDPWHTVIAWIDCRAGGAQEAFEDLCRGFERAGWEIEKRVFDFRYVRRGLIRWEVGIGGCPSDLAKALAGPGFMALLAADLRQHKE